MKEGERTGMLIGYVSDERYAALADVLLEFENSSGGSWEVRSRASGAVHADHPPGEYRVTLSKPGFGSKRVHLTVKPGRPHHFRLLSDRLLGYAWPKCLRSGESAEFRVHAVEEYKLELYRYGWEKELVCGLGWHDEHGPRATQQITPDGDYTRTGVGWNKVGYHNPVQQQRVLAPARSGLYYFHASTRSGASFTFPWVVAPAQPQAPIAVLASNLTWNAYNSFGGRSNYINADELTLTPNLTAREGVTMWGQIGTPGQPAPTVPLSEVTPQRISFAEGTAKDVYDVAHPIPWGWRVSSYLWTKSISAGALGVAAPLALLGGMSEPFGLVASVIACLFALITVAFLVWDLKRPERFWFILLKPNFRSWLVWGAYILVAFSGLAVLWGASALFDVRGAMLPLGIAGAAFAAASAGYSGFLFGQAELHLVAQAAVAGAAALGIAAVALADTAAAPVLIALVAAGVLAHALFVAAELATPHANADVELAAHAMTRGRDARLFWVGAVLVGVGIPLAAVGAWSLAILAVAPAMLVAALAALVGLFAYEDSWIRAGQAVPLS